jgi:transcriptional regulator with XRE-family HTH domain
MLRIKFLRLSRGVSQWALSQEAGISQGRYSYLERGLIEPTSEERERLAQALHASPGSLFHQACRIRHAAAVPSCSFDPVPPFRIREKAH